MKDTTTNKKQPRIAFIGTAPIAARLLEHLIEDGLPIEYVITQPDKLQGRKKKPVFPAVKQTALDHGLEVYQPEKIRSFMETMEKSPLDLIITCAYGQILPKAMLDYPAHGAINLHGSLLPKYRGGAPVQRAIWNAEPVSGVSLMQMDEGMDSGPVYAMKEMPIKGMNTDQLFDAMADEGFLLIKEWLPSILDGSAVAVAQNADEVTFAPVLKSEEEKLDLNQPDEKIIGQILAFAPKPGVYISIDGKKLKIFDADYQDTALEKGRFKKEGKSLLLGTGEGRLLLKRVQPEGKKEMDALSYLNGAGKALDGKEAD